jgi:hypothetical protein
MLLLRMMNISLLFCFFRIEEAKEWVMRLKQSGGCNLLKAMKHIYKLKDIDSIMLVLGSV